MFQLLLVKRGFVFINQIQYTLFVTIYIVHFCCPSKSSSLVITCCIRLKISIKNLQKHHHLHTMELQLREHFKLERLSLILDRKRKKIKFDGKTLPASSEWFSFDNETTSSKIYYYN